MVVSHDRRSDEETPLLQQKSKTHLPWSQISLALLTLIAEPFSSLYIFSFINQLIGELGITGGDDRKIGYYAGLIESLFFLTQALTTWQWGRLSDSMGRRPLILFGLFGLSVSNFAFGLSRTLGTLIISRCIAGVLNGNVGVMKSMLGDLTDDTNMAQVFTLVLPISRIGGTIAPLYGGALTKPQEQWPHIFQGEFWATYPYFLPSLVSGCFTLSTFLVCMIFMKESLPSKVGKQPPLDRPTDENPPDDSPANDAQPVPVLTLLKTYSVMMPVVNYGVLGLVYIAILVLLPLFCSSPIEIGGLGLPPSIIGVLLSAFGILDGIVQTLFGAKLIEWFGAKKLFCYAILCFYPLILLFPIMSAVVTAQGVVGPIIWILLVMQLISMVLMDLAFPAIFIFVTTVAPNKQSFGSVNGISQASSSIARAIAPTLTTSLFAVSKEYNILGGNLVFAVLAMVTTLFVLLSRHLPDLKDRK